MSQKIKNNSVKQLRWIGNAEGISYLILLFVAMPLKYLFDYPMAVKVNGWVHGALFMVYIAAVLKTAYIIKWDFMRVGIALLASLIPFATFVLDKKLQQNQRLY
jgi:integral membrane protein